MHSPSLISALSKIEQHVHHLDHKMNGLALNNTLRINKMYQKLTHCIEEIYRKGEGWTDQDVHLILDAMQFASHKHHGQLRKDLDQTSYIIHPFSVAFQLLSIGKVRDPAIIEASLLHDALEDTETSYEELEKIFGKRVADFVQEVTDDKTLPKEVRKRLQIVQAPYKSAGAAQIKLADKWDNLSDLLIAPPIGWNEDRVQAYFEWAAKVIDSLPWVNAPLLRAVQGVLRKRIHL